MSVYRTIGPLVLLSIFCLITASDETCLKPTATYQNLAIITTDTTERQAGNSDECASTYQELDQETRIDTEYSTLDEITPS